MTTEVALAQWHGALELRDAREAADSALDLGLDAPPPPEADASAPPPVVRFFAGAGGAYGYVLFGGAARFVARRFVRNADELKAVGGPGAAEAGGGDEEEKGPAFPLSSVMTPMLLVDEAPV